MDFSKYLFRASALAHLLADTKEKSNLDKYNDGVALLDKLKSEYSAMDKVTKKGEPSKLAENKLEKIKALDLDVRALEAVKDEVTLSDGAKTHLMDIYIRETTGRKTEIENRYIKKGLQCEEDAITLYSRVKKSFFKKNETHLKNLFIMGTPDIFEGESIHSATRIPDIKTSWDIFTFYRTFTKKLATLYFWQIIAYMWLTGARKGSVAYCLVDTPEPLIKSELNRLWYKLGQPNENSEIMEQAEKELHKNMTYADIDFRKRVLEYEVEWSDEYPIKIEKYVKAGRKYLAEIHEQLTLKQS